MKDIMSNKCPHCGSNHVEYITRVTGFFSKVGSWNKGNIAELRDRRTAIEANRNMLGGLKEEDTIDNKKEIKFFWKEGCIKCPEAKKLCKNIMDDGFEVNQFDVETVEGLAESSMYMVMATPSFIVTIGGEEIKAWRGVIPELSEIENTVG